MRFTTAIIFAASAALSNAVDTEQSNIVTEIDEKNAAEEIVA